MNGRSGILERASSKSYSTPDRYKFQKIPLNEMQHASIKRWCSSRFTEQLRFNAVGMILGNKIPCRNTDRGMICSEFVLRALQEADFFLEFKDPSDTNPNQLFHLVDDLLKTQPPEPQSMVSRY